MKSLFSILFFLTTLTITVSAQGRKSQYNVDKAALAIEGYDPVAYFTSGKAIKGKKEITISYESITYRFSSVQNKNLFKANPSKYEPQYGGWCAYAMGTSGEKVSVDPETFKVLNGKLYLFYNSFINNTLKSWNKDETGLKTSADKNWQKFN
jgi:YHS domain-containing protein